MSRALFLLIVVGLFIGCSKDEEKRMKPELSGVTYSECGGFKSRIIVPDFEETEKLVIMSAADGYYTLDHTNVLFNCCLPAGLSADLTLADDTLYLSEKETQPGNCRCLCRYDLMCEIKNLEEGSYVLCLMRDSIVRGAITLFFNDGMHEEVLISELIE